MDPATFPPLECDFDDREDFRLSKAQQKAPPISKNDIDHAIAETVLEQTQRQTSWAISVFEACMVRSSWRVYRPSSDWHGRNGGETVSLHNGGSAAGWRNPPLQNCLRNCCWHPALSSREWSAWDFVPQCLRPYLRSSLTSAWRPNESAYCSRSGNFE